MILNIITKVLKEIKFYENDLIMTETRENSNISKLTLQKFIEIKI